VALSYSDFLARNDRPEWWYIAIEGIRKRYGTRQPSWNPADTGTNRYVDLMLARPPRFGSQTADPLNGKCSIPTHSIALHDYDDEITELLAVSDTPAAKTFLTASIDSDAATIPVETTDDFDTEGDIYIDRETIHHTGKGSDTSSGTADVVTGTCDADPSGASDVRIYDAARTETNDYWTGGWIKFTGGLNNGQARRITRFVGSSSDQWWANPDDQDDTMYIDPNNPLPNNVAAGDTYELHQAPHRLRDAVLTEPSRYWNGAQVLIVADANFPENIGEIRYVKYFRASTDTLEFYEPFPGPIGSGTQWSMRLKTFTGCTRGMYDSEAEEHSVLDAQGDPIPIDVVDRVPYMKTRRVRIYHSFVGLDETESVCRMGVLRNWKLDQSGEVYHFEISGLLEVLSGKILARQGRGRIVHKPLWGGSFHAYYQPPTRDSADWWPWPVMSDQEEADSNYSVTEIFYEAETGFRWSGNVKIGEELIHYDGVGTEMSGVYGYTGRRLLILGDHVDFDKRHQHQDVWLPTHTAGGAQVNPAELCIDRRGLFAEKIGLRPVQAEVGNLAFYRNEVGNTIPSPPSINAMIQEHVIGDEILQAMVCDDSPNSDFPQFDELEVSGTAGTLTVGETITGDLSGVEAEVIDVDRLTSDGVVVVVYRDGELYKGEGLTATDGWTADLDDYKLGNGEDLPARNNPFTVWLQLLCSTGDLGSNGPYDTLPAGWGLGVDEDLVDIDAIEALRDRYFKATRIEFCVHEPSTLLEWSTDNLWRYLQVWPFETHDGRVSLGYLYTEPECRAADDGSLRELDDDDLEAERLPSWNSGKPPVTKVVVELNRHPVKSDYFSTIEINFARSQKYYQDLGETVQISTGVLYLPMHLAKQINPLDPELPEFLSRLINPMWGRHSTHPAPVIGCRVDRANIDIDIGEVVKLTEPSMPNLRTGCRGFSGEYFQVVGVQDDIDGGCVRLTLWQVGVHDRKYGRRAPSAMVYSYAANTPVAGKSTITLYQSMFAAGDDYDRDWFAAGDEIMVMDNSWTPIAGAVPEESTIESVGTGASHTLVLDQNLTNAPAQGDIVEIARYDNAASDHKSTFVFWADYNRLLGAGDDTAFKYR
jgi:hypothetical protein